MKHYFHDFSAEGVGEAYRMFTGSWRTPTTIKYMGISEDSVKSDTGFVLVKLVKPKARMDIVCYRPPPFSGGSYLKVIISKEGKERG